MRTDIRYISNNGHEMVFGGDDDSLHYFEHELLSNTWEYELGVAKNRVSSFSRKPVEKKFPVGIAAKDAEEGIAKRNEILQLGDFDVAAGKAGRLYVGDWYINCWIVGVSFTNYWMNDRFAEVELKLLVERCEWTFETIKQYQPVHTLTGTVNGADYEYDFEHDYAADAPSFEVDVAGAWPCDFLWRAYGPAINPYMRVGQNVYRVNVQVPDGARLEVNSREKTIRLISKDGIETDEYASRSRGAKGSGSYIFEPIATGRNVLSWDNTYTFDLILFHVSSLPPFELKEQ